MLSQLIHTPWHSSILSAWAHVAPCRLEVLQALSPLLRGVLPRPGLGLFLQDWNHILIRTTRWIPPFQTAYGILFSMVSYELQKSASQQLTRRGTVTKHRVRYHSSFPKVSCKCESSTNSEVTVLSEDQNTFEKEIQGLQSQKNPVLNHTWPTLM